MNPENEQTFEERLSALEDLVKKMENGALPLEETLACYREGMKMAESLSASLTRAEKTMLEYENGKLVPMEDAP